MGVGIIALELVANNTLLTIKLTKNRLRPLSSGGGP